MKNIKIFPGIFIATLFIMPLFLLWGYNDTFVIYVYGGFLCATFIHFLDYIGSKQFKRAILVFTLSLVSVFFLLACLLSQPMTV